ncbi:MAG: hypothetical protein N3F10_06650 [Candidatus Bathyarchaeota archaeon]|nr:hypothetical protein [Candidatus Bathyarchaeota archaeon]
MTTSKAAFKCVELVEEMLSRGYRLQISSKEVEKLIKISVGADKRTVQKYMRMLTEDLAFLKTAIKNPFGITIYRIDIEAAEQFINERLKGKLRQLKLSDIRLKQNSMLEE